MHKGDPSNRLFEGLHITGISTWSAQLRIIESEYIGISGNDSRPVEWLFSGDGSSASPDFSPVSVLAIE